VLANQLATVKAKRHQQQGHSLVQSLLGLLLSMLVLMAAFSAFGWVQTSHRQLQAQAEVQQRLRSAMHLVRQRVQRAGAAELTFVSGKARIDDLDDALYGSDDSLSLMHPSSLTPFDCQGHEASSSWWLIDDFTLRKQELQCKDSWRDDTNYQALFDGLRQWDLLYAQALTGTTTHLQWRRAEEVSDWNAVRGVKVCIQALAHNPSPLPASNACGSTGLLQSPSLAWRGVASFRHHRQ